jgi:hypothetical protein
MGGNGGDTGGSDDQQVARPGHILPALTFPAKVAQKWWWKLHAGHWGAVGRSSLKQSRGGSRSADGANIGRATVPPRTGSRSRRSRS